MTEPKHKKLMFVLNDGKKIERLKATNFDDAADEVASYQGFTWIYDEEGLKTLIKSAISSLNGRPHQDVVHYIHACSPEWEGTVELWYVRGTLGWYPTKLSAEVAARAMFPDETPSERYARIFSNRFINEHGL